MFDVFVRNWWKIVNGKRVPHLGRKTYLARRLSEDAARQYCKEYNACHDPGKLSRKAEFEER